MTSSKVRRREKKYSSGEWVTRKNRSARAPFALVRFTRRGSRDGQPLWVVNKIFKWGKTPGTINRTMLPHGCTGAYTPNVVRDTPVVKYLILDWPFYSRQREVDWRGNCEEP